MPMARNPSSLISAKAGCGQHAIYGSALASTRCSKPGPSNTVIYAQVGRRCVQLHLLVGVLTEASIVGAQRAVLKVSGLDIGVPNRNSANLCRLSVRTKPAPSTIAMPTKLHARSARALESTCGTPPRSTKCQSAMARLLTTATIPTLRFWAPFPATTAISYGKFAHGLMAHPRPRISTSSALAGL